MMSASGVTAQESRLSVWRSAVSSVVGLISAIKGFCEIATSAFVFRCASWDRLPSPAASALIAKTHHDLHQFPVSSLAEKLSVTHDGATRISAGRACSRRIATSSVPLCLAARCRKFYD